MAVVRFEGSGNNDEPLKKMVWIQFRNDSAYQVPAFGILRITGFNTSDPEQPFFTIDRPNTYGSQYLHAINGPLAIEANGYGECTLGQYNTALYDTSDGTPAVGEMWGTRSGTFMLKKNTGGFVVLGVIYSTYGMVLVAPDPMLQLVAVPSAFVQHSASGTFSIWAGSPGSEADTSQTITAYSRLGICLPYEKYSIQRRAPTAAPEWEVVNPTKSIIGVADAAIAKGASGTISVWSSLGGSYADTGTNITATFLAAAVVISATVKCDWSDGYPGWLGGAVCP